jgi:ATP-dependent Lon protease
MIASKPIGRAESKKTKDSLERQWVLESQIRAIQEEMRLDSHRTDLKEQINELRKDVEEEKSLRRPWALRCGVIDAEFAQLRKGALGGVRIQDRRPDEPPSDD